MPLTLLNAPHTHNQATQPTELDQPTNTKHKHSSRQESQVHGFSKDKIRGKEHASHKHEKWVKVDNTKLLKKEGIRHYLDMQNLGAQ